MQGENILNLSSRLRYDIGRYSMRSNILTTLRGRLGNLALPRRTSLVVGLGSVSYDVALGPSKIGRILKTVVVPLILLKLLKRRADGILG